MGNAIADPQTADRTRSRQRPVASAESHLRGRSASGRGEALRSRYSLRRPRPRRPYSCGSTRLRDRYTSALAPREKGSSRIRKAKLTAVKGPGHRSESKTVRLRWIEGRAGTDSRRGKSVATARGPTYSKATRAEGRCSRSTATAAAAVAAGTHSTLASRPVHRPNRAAPATTTRDLQSGSTDHPSSPAGELAASPAQKHSRSPLRSQRRQL